jgi:hypothetical protein
MTAIACASASHGAPVSTPSSAAFEEIPTASDAPSGGLKEEDVIGRCYALNVSGWRPELDLGRDLDAATPPSKIELSRTRIPHDPWAPPIEYFLLVAAPHTPPTRHRNAHWRVRPEGFLELSWNTGFSGLVMLLQSDDGTLQGTATTFWDSGRPRQVADVRAEAVPCDREPRR